MSRIACMIIVAVVAASAWVFGGCQPAPNVVDPFLEGPKAAQGKVPRPYDLLLPQRIRIHPFTAMRMLEDRDVRGVEVRIEALDAFGDPTKAFGDVRFELYAYRANSPDNKGKCLNVWQASINDPVSNVAHWDHVMRAYLFKLEMTRQSEPAATERYVLVAVFASPYTKRLFAEHVMTVR